MTAEPFDLRRALVADLHAAGSPATASLIADSKAPETWADPATWICLREWREWPLLSERVRAAIVAAAEPAPTCGLTLAGVRCDRLAAYSAEPDGPDGERLYACTPHIAANREWEWERMEESVEGWESPGEFALRRLYEHGEALWAVGIRARDDAHLSVLLRVLDEPDDRMRALLLAHVGRVRG